jgi:hypothetical protein
MVVVVVVVEGKPQVDTFIAHDGVPMQDLPNLAASYTYSKKNMYNWTTVKRDKLDKEAKGTVRAWHGVAWQEGRRKDRLKGAR